MSEVSDPWLDRARSLTSELVKDTDSLGRYDRALLWARLGQLWQQRDVEHARAWVEQAVQAVEAAPDKGDAAEQSQCLNTARRLLVILGARDKALSARLNKVLDAAMEDAASSNRGEDAGAKAEAGLAVVDSNPQRALQFGLASLRGGGPYQLARLLWRLRKGDPSLSETLFTAIIEAARASNYNPHLLSLLPKFAFQGPSPSDKLRGSLLDVLAEGLLRVPTSTQEQSAICQLSSLAVPLLPEFQRLLPQRAVMVRAQLDRCLSILEPAAHKEVNDSLQEKPLNTIDDLLGAANSATDAGQRVAYLNRAAYMAFNEKKYDRAITILDSFSSEEREQADKMSKGLWASWRMSFASSAAIEHLRQGDRQLMTRIIAATPSPLRPSVQISVAAELARRDGPAAKQLLDEARAALAKADVAQGFGASLPLVRAYAALNASDALPALLDAVKMMNRSESSQTGDNADDAEASIPILSNDILLSGYALPASLLAIDEMGTRQIIASVNSATRRAAIRLNLLNAVLRQSHGAAVKPAIQAKDQNNAN